MADWSPTHPLRAYRPEYMTRDEFKNSLDSALRNYYQEGLRPQHYQKVKVVIACWEMDKNEHLNIGNFTTRLADVFSKSYHYNVEFLTLQSFEDEPQGFMKVFLNLIINSLSADDLVIFYYIGHASTEPDREALLLRPTWQQQSLCPLIDFIQIRKEIIDNAKPDVLILLDCCYSGTLSRGAECELIAASVHDMPAYNGIRSFSSNLIQQLQHAAATKQILTTPQLYARLATRAMMKDTDGEKLLATTPIHIQNYGQQRVPIYLAPLTTGSDWNPAPLTHHFSQPVNVTLSVHLRDANAATLDELRSWLTRGRPACADRIVFQSITPTQSAVIIFGATIDVWCSLPDHPAISFIAFSQNKHMPLAVTPTTSHVRKQVDQSKDNNPFSKYQGEESPFSKLKENRPPTN